MENLPIDIHSNKLLDWLISRRHCPKNWQNSVDEIRQKISHAMEDMPESEQILAILSGEHYINYFHCKRILELLQETEKDTKNMFGFYSSQRFKDWKEVIGLYERENVYLAEAANFLQRFVQYEVPALRRQFAKVESASRESERKEQDFLKAAAESRRAFDRELAKWGLIGGGHSQGADLHRALLAIADTLPPAKLAILPELTQTLDHFDLFSEFICQDDTSDMFSLLRLLATRPPRPVGEVTVYEWKHGKVPDVVVPPARLQMTQAEETREDEIDFGDATGEEETDIDFCTNGETIEAIQLVPVGNDEQQQALLEGSVLDGIARGDEALPVLEHPPTRVAFIDQLDQLCAFLEFRLQDELADTGTAGLYLAGMAQKSPEIDAVGLEQLKSWLDSFRQTATELGDPQQLQLLRIRSSQRFLDEIVSQLEHKRRLELKYQQLEQLEAKKQQDCALEIQQTQKHLDRVIEAAKTLQENLEADISRRYNGREVYIMGEINAVLYGS